MKKFLSIFLLIGALASFSLSGSAQNKSNDWKLLMQSGLPESAGETPVNKGFFPSVIKPQMAATCQFEFNCSSFGPAMRKRYGLLKGFFLTIDRWVRCTRISVIETYNVRLTAGGKIKESPEDFHSP